MLLFSYTATIKDKSHSLTILFDFSQKLQVNPFRDQICKVFSSSGDGLTFEDFLDMMSVFSDAAPKNVKVEYAFRVYGE